MMLTILLQQYDYISKTETPLSCYSAMVIIVKLDELTQMMTTEMTIRRT